MTLQTRRRAGALLVVAIALVVAATGTTALLSIEASSFAASRSPDALSIIKLLLAAGADARTPPPKGWSDDGDTSLIFVSRLTLNAEVVGLLLRYGSKLNTNTTAWVNQRNAKGNTALFAAARCDGRVSGGRRKGAGGGRATRERGRRPFD
jgi:hypothetical protein